MSVAAPETANQFWVEFSAQVETIKNNLANPPDSGTPVFVLVLKDSITDLQRCMLYTCLYFNFNESTTFV